VRRVACFAAEPNLFVMSGFHISLPPSVASLQPSIIVVSGVDSQGASIPIRRVYLHGVEASLTGQRICSSIGNGSDRPAATDESRTRRRSNT
jgi:hypothetical protein